MAENENKFFKMVKETATKTASAATKAAETVKKNAEEKVQVAKNNNAISTINGKIAAIFKEIGEIVYQSEQDTIDRAQFQEKLDQIKAYYDEISSLKLQSAELRNMVICPACKKECRENEEYCSACGAKLKD